VRFVEKEKEARASQVPHTCRAAAPSPSVRSRANSGPFPSSSCLK
jgi:hypothetical protein